MRTVIIHDFIFNLNDSTIKIKTQRILLTGTRSNVNRQIDSTQQMEDERIAFKNIWLKSWNK